MNRTQTRRQTAIGLRCPRKSRVSGCFICNGTPASTWVFMLICSAAFAPSVEASGVPFQTGDILAGVGNGKIKHFSPLGTLLDTLDTGAGGTEDTGMAFDAAGNLFATVFQANNVYKFDHSGNRIATFGSGYNRDPESIVFDKNGNAFVGQADGVRQVLKFNPTGALLEAYSPQTGPRGTDWIDLAADQCTLQYTSEGSTIRRFDVCTRTQLTAFPIALTGPCYANRIRPNFEILVACTSRAYRLNSTGTAVLQAYQLQGTSLLFALNLDPDNKSFWTADYFTGTVFRVDIATGSVMTQFNAGVFQTLAGLTVVGELTAATSVPPSTTSYYIALSNTATVNGTILKISDTVHGLGVRLAQSQIAANIAQDSVVALLFGGTVFGPPKLAAGEYGATLWGHANSVSDIASLVQDFATGYYHSLGANRTLHVRIVIATSNGGNAVTAAHGQAWAEMVNSVASWVVNQGYSGQVDIAGGINIESGFNGFDITRRWIDGYASVARRFLYNLGAAYGYTQENLWYLSWGSPPAEPLPEIYSTGNATQWANLSSYGAQQHNESVIMAGALTEVGACVQHPDDTCKPTPFTPAQGWQALYDKLKDVGTAQTLPWSTDIRWCDAAYLNCYDKN
jgi:hypothetical protein